MLEAGEKKKDISFIDLLRGGSTESAEVKHLNTACSDIWVPVKCLTVALC